MGKVVIVNALTGEVVEREQTSDEIAQAEQDQLEAAKLQQAEQDKSDAVKSARNKLAKLGLTSDEITALVGG